MRGVLDSEVRAFYFFPEPVGFREVFFFSGDFARFGESKYRLGNLDFFLEYEAEEFDAFEEYFRDFFRISDYVGVERFVSFSSEFKECRDRFRRIEIVFKGGDEVCAGAFRFLNTRVIFEELFGCDEFFCFG